MEYTELDHLNGKDPVVAEIYEKLIAALHKFGPIRIEPKKQAYILLTVLGLLSKIVYDVVFKTEKEKTLKAFSTHDYVVKNITEIKGTSIIIVDIYSEGIYTLDTTTFVFSPTWSYYF